MYGKNIKITDPKKMAFRGNIEIGEQRERKQFDQLNIASDLSLFSDCVCWEEESRGNGDGWCVLCVFCVFVYLYMCDGLFMCRLYSVW